MSDKPSFSPDAAGDALSARIGQLRLRDLLLLDHLAETGSLRRAAQRLHVTQPAVTQALRGLERAFGVVLAERSQRGVTLTPAGQAALERLRVARRELLAAQAAAQQPQTTVLRLGALPLASLALLPPVLARMRRMQPQVRLDLVESTVAVLWQALSDGRLDAIVCRLPSPREGGALPAGVMCQPVGEERLTLVARSGHPMLRRGPPTPQVLAEQDWVLPPHGTFTRMLFDELFVRSGLAPPAAGVTSASFHTNLNLAAAGDMLAVTPASALARYGRTLRLKEVPVRWAADSDRIVLAWRETASPLPALAWLRDNLAPHDSRTENTG